APAASIRSGGGGGPSSSAESTKLVGRGADDAFDERERAGDAALEHADARKAKAHATVAEGRSRRCMRCASSNARPPRFKRCRARRVAGGPAVLAALREGFRPWYEAPVRFLPLALLAPLALTACATSRAVPAPSSSASASDPPLARRELPSLEDEVDFDAL